MDSVKIVSTKCFETPIVYLITLALFGSSGVYRRAVFAGKYFPEVENLDNWHGKPLGKKAQQALEAVKKLITQPGPHGLKPLPIQDDAPKVTFPQVTLNEPPNYKLGDKVRERE